jgi:hypothetical protein
MSYCYEDGMLVFLQRSLTTVFFALKLQPTLIYSDNSSLSPSTFSFFPTPSQLEKRNTKFQGLATDHFFKYKISDSMSFELNIDSPIVSLIRRSDNFCFVYIFPILLCLQHGTVPPIAVGGAS